MKLIIISGMSGSGKTVALNTIEDLGYYCIDNLPADLLPALADQFLTEPHPGFENAAVSIDARNRLDHIQEFPDILRGLKMHGLDCEMFFLRAEEPTLIKRFSETRRRHPLSRSGMPLSEAMKLESQLLDPIAAQADLIIETTHTNVHELRALISQRMRSQDENDMSVLLQSFGFKHGIPTDADFVFDVRCLPNPHWEPHLRSLTGRDPEVVQFLEGQESVITMHHQIDAFLSTWIPAFMADNRNYLNIAIGCTGGQHRSVYMVERLGRELADRVPNLSIRHREQA